MPDYGLGENPTDDIIIAGGNLEYCSSITGEIIAGSFVSIGYTAKEAGGVFRDAESRFKDVFATGLDDPVKRKALDKDVTFKVTVIQANLQNMAIAAGGLPSDAAGGKFRGGKSKDAPVLKWRYTVLNADKPTGGHRLYIPCGKVVDVFEIPWKDDAETAFVLTIKAYAAPATVLEETESFEGYRYLLLEGSF